MFTTDVLMAQVRDRRCPRSPAVATGRPRVLVIGGNPTHVLKAQSSTLGVVHNEFPDEYDLCHWPFVDQALLLQYDDIGPFLPLVRALHEAYPIRAAMSLLELGVLPAARTNESLGLARESVATAKLPIDEWPMRQHLAATGISLWRPRSAVPRRTFR